MKAGGKEAKTKLEDIKKAPVYTVPDGYFDALPNAIVAKATARKKKRLLYWANPYVKLGVPAALVLIVLVLANLVTNNKHIESPESLLAQVSMEEIIEYLEESDITTDELIEEVALLNSETELFGSEHGLLNGVENLEGEELEELLDNYDLMSNGEYL